MAIVSQRAVLVTDEDEIVVGVELHCRSAGIRVVFDLHHAAAAGGPNLGAFGHLPVNGELVSPVMAEGAVATLGDREAAARSVGQFIDDGIIVRSVAAAELEIIRVRIMP